MISQPEDSVESSRPSPDEYNHFISGLELRSIRLVRSAVSAPHPYNGEELSARVRRDDARYEPVDGGFRVFDTLVFHGGEEPDAEPHGSVSIEAEYAVEYSSAHLMTDALFTIFSRVNLPVNTWPYFREYVQATLGRVGWPIATLPAFKIGAGPRAALKRRPRRRTDPPAIGSGE